MHPAIQALVNCSRTFGKVAAQKKQKLLRDIEALQDISLQEVRTLHDTLYFMLAYPDSPAIRKLVLRLSSDIRTRIAQHGKRHDLPASFMNSGLPGSTNAYSYSYAVLQSMVRSTPSQFSIDWETLEDDSGLLNALSLAVLPAEQQSLEDISLQTSDWVAQSKPQSKTELQFILDLIESSGMTHQQQVQAFEQAELPILYHLKKRGSGRCEIRRASGAIHYQKKDIPKDKFPLRPEIEKPLLQNKRLSAQAGQAVLDLSLRSLGCRHLEIYPLMYGNPADVSLCKVGHGVEVVLCGVLPEYRNALESLYFYMLLKNGVPVAYGPASVFMGSCEMGMNLFPEFRGGEVRFFYAQFMRCLYHLTTARYFYLTSYGMGENNDEALDSGAFWFYRKMGFQPTNPAVEVIAQQEEDKMRSQPGYRCSRRTLRRLSPTSAYLDLSDGRCQPWNFGRLGLLVSNLISERYAGNRQRAQEDCQKRLFKILPIKNISAWSPSAKNALRTLAPLLLLITDLPRWSLADKSALAACIRNKGARSEYGYLRCLWKSPRFESALQTLCDNSIV